jgi:hypothetical protein
MNLWTDTYTFTVAYRAIALARSFSLSDVDSGGVRSNAGPPRYNLSHRLRSSSLAGRILIRRYL